MRKYNFITDGAGDFDDGGKLNYRVFMMEIGPSDIVISYAAGFFFVRARRIRLLDGKMRRISAEKEEQAPAVPGAEQLQNRV